jgi:hypothetical protein
MVSNHILRMELLKTPFISICSLFSIESLNWLQLSESVKFAGQSTIGILTVYYLVLKIKKIRK